MVPQRLIFRSIKRSHDLFVNDQGCVPAEDPQADKISKSIRAVDQYGPIIDLVDLKTPNKLKDFSSPSKSSIINSSHSRKLIVWLLILFSFHRLIGSLYLLFFLIFF